MANLKSQISNRKSQMPFAICYLIVAIFLLAACQAWTPSGPDVAPPSVSPVATPSAQPPQGTPTEVAGNPPGPVLALASLPDGEFLAGVGPVGNAETGFEWRLYRGQGDTWQRLAWPAEAVPRVLRPTSGGALIFAVPFSNAMYGRGQAWGLMRSTDGGRSWQQALTGLDDPNVMDLALSPAFGADRTLWAVTWYNGVYRSTDAGESWQALPPPKEGVVEPSGGANPYDLALAFSPDYRPPSPGDQADSGRGLALASFARGLQRWDPAAEAWQTIPLSVTATVKDYDPPEAQLAAGAIAFSPNFADDGTIYLQSGYGGIFRSTDRGKTWLPIQRRLKLPAPPVADFYLAVASADEAYVLLPGSQADAAQVLYRTRDGGTTWESLDNPPTLGWVSAFALGRDAMGHTVLYLGGSRGGVISYVADSLRWD
jgi:hypothetical protein